MTEGSLPSPLDDSQPIPEYRAPGEPPKTTVPPPADPAWEGASPVIEGPEPKENPVVLATRARVKAAQEEDANLRVLATVLKLRGYKTTEVAKILGTDARRVIRVLRQARQDGNLDDVLADLKFEALPLAVEKLIDKLEKGDWEAVRETLRGLGAFRTYTQQTSDGGGDNRTLNVQFIMPPAPQAVNPRGIVGRPREVIDATVQEVREQAPAALGQQPDGATGTGSGGSGREESGDEALRRRLQAPPRERESATTP